MCSGNPNWSRPAPYHLHHDGIWTKGGLLLLRSLRARRHRHALLDRCAQEQLEEEEEEEEEAEQLQEGGGGDNESDQVGVICNELSGVENCV